MRRPQNHDLLLRFWSSKSLFAILSHTIHYQFQSVLDSQVLCTSEFGPFLQFLKIFVFLFRQPWKLTTNLFGYCSKDCQCLSFVLLMLCSSQPIRPACKCNTILDVSGAAILKQKRLLLYYYLMYHYRVNWLLMKNNLKMYIKSCFTRFSN